MEQITSLKGEMDQAEGCHGDVSEEEQKVLKSTEEGSERLKKERDEFESMTSNVLNEINERMKAIRHVMSMLDEIKSDLEKTQGHLATRKRNRNTATNNQVDNDVSI